MNWANDSGELPDFTAILLWPAAFGFVMPNGKVRVRNVATGISRSRCRPVHKATAGAFKLGVQPVS